MRNATSVSTSPKPSSEARRLRIAVVGRIMASLRKVAQADAVLERHRILGVALLVAGGEAQGHSHVLGTRGVGRVGKDVVGLQSGDHLLRRVAHGAVGTGLGAAACAGGAGV